MRSHHGLHIQPSWLIGFYLLVALLPPQHACEAVTPGRAWSPTEVLSVAQFGQLYSPRLELGSDRVPFLFAAAQYPYPDVLGFDWRGSSWAQATHVGRGLYFSWPVWAPPGEFYVVGQDPFSDTEGKAWFWLAHRVGDSFEIENVTRAYPEVDDYSAAVSARRRWVMFQDGFGAGMRLLYSDGPGNWIETPISARGGSGLVIIPLGDTTALAAWAGLDDGLRWGKLEGTTWIPGAEPLGGRLCINPLFRRRPSGGYWFGYATDEPYVAVRTYEDDVWGSPAGITASYRVPGWSWARYSKDFQMSQDDGEYPAIAWGFFDGNAGAGGICVSVPTDAGWTVADQLDNDTEGILPSVTRDLNGDVWVAFWRYYTNGVFWAHTYTKAACTLPIVYQQGASNLVAWTLSEPAPETWWAVLREQADGSFASVARVRAAEVPQMSWRDESPVSGVRYRIRRECVDTRYQWLSEVSDTPVAVMLSLISAEASPGKVRLSWYAKDAAGAATISRRTEGTAWIEIGSPTTAEEGLLTYVDSGLPAGRYAYRLQLGGDVTPEVWVEVPAGFAVALAGFQPNPAVHSLHIAFTLADDSPATVEVFAVNGRRVLAREVGSLGAGDHVLDVAREADMHPGVYWIRLTQAGASLTRKGVLAN
jgi:hypothetical protein